MRLPPILAVLLSAPAAAVAQLQTLELSFTGIECASCLDSLPARIQRLRGVESARVDAAKKLLAVKFAGQNRIRLEQIRDAIEQDGTKVRDASLTATGLLAEATPGDGRWLLLLPNGSQFEVSVDGGPPSVQYALKPGRVAVAGLIGQVRPAAGPMIIAVKSIEAVDR